VLIQARVEFGVALLDRQFCEDSRKRLPGYTQGAGRVSGFDPDFPDAATVRACAEDVQVEIQFDLEDLSVGEFRTLRISEVGRST
jgi:hypothetical protein